MTREQQINKASIANSNSLSEAIRFARGARWADEHPVDVRHDASEEPRCEELLLGEDSNGFSIYRWCGQEDNWEAFVNVTGLSRWAYIRAIWWTAPRYNT